MNFKITFTSLATLIMALFIFTYYSKAAAECDMLRLLNIKYLSLLFAILKRGSLFYYIAMIFIKSNNGHDQHCINKTIMYAILNCYLNTIEPNSIVKEIIELLLN